jgi:oligopeptide/dipeptide ABC transporter ATP-binding protein
MSAPLVDLAGLCKTYALPRHSLFQPRRRIVAVDDVSFSIEAGGTFGLVGESGSGKTTVAKILLKLEAPTSGRVIVDGEDVFAQSVAQERAYRRKVQAVLQDPYGALSQRMRVDRIVAEPLLAQGLATKQEALAVARAKLEAVGLRPDAATRYPHQFSGGQRQRIAIARALSVDPTLLVLDEPVSALDVSVRAQILGLLREVQQRFGTSFLFIGHDLAIVRYMSSSVGVMYFGRLVEIGPAAALFRQPLHPYTKKLVEVAAALKPLGDVRLSGGLPDPLAPPPGCSFASRCSFAAARCREETPALRDMGGGRRAACHFAETLPLAA